MELTDWRKLEEKNIIITKSIVLGISLSISSILSWLRSRVGVSSSITFTSMSPLKCLLSGSLMTSKLLSQRIIFGFSHHLTHQQHLIQLIIPFSLNYFFPWLPANHAHLMFFLPLVPITISTACPVLMLNDAALVLKSSFSLSNTLSLGDLI